MSDHNLQSHGPICLKFVLGNSAEPQNVLGIVWKLLNWEGLTFIWKTLGFSCPALLLSCSGIQIFLYITFKKVFLIRRAHKLPGSHLYEPNFSSVFQFQHFGCFDPVVKHQKYNLKESKSTFKCIKSIKQLNSMPYSFIF